MARDAWRARRQQCRRDCASAAEASIRLQRDAPKRPFRTESLRVPRAAAYVALDAGWRRAVRLTAATGFLGGYTTYSTFAVEVTGLSALTPPAWGAVYAAASVVVGVAAAGLGYAAAHRIHTPPLTGEELDA